MEVSLTRIPYLLYRSTWESHIFAFNNNVFRQDFSGESFVKHHGPQNAITLLTITRV